jgi:TetR/AcrR family transcriptional regulator
MAKYRKDGTTEEKILDAARKVFVRKGMYGARMQDIADEAGINKALLHYYFKNKEKLFEHIFLEAASKLFPRINAIFGADLPLFTKLEQFCEEYISIVVENPYLPLFVLNEMNRDPVYFMNKLWGKDKRPEPQKFIQDIQAAIKSGLIKEVSPFQLLLNLLSLTIFPFIGKPVFQMTLGVDEIQFRMAMEQRKKDIPRFIIDAIKK